MTEQEMKEYVDSLERELDGYRKLGTQRKIKAALRRDSKARHKKKHHHLVFEANSARTQHSLHPLGIFQLDGSHNSQLYSRIRLLLLQFFQSHVLNIK